MSLYSIFTTFSVVVNLWFGWFFFKNLLSINAFTLAAIDRLRAFHLTAEPARQGRQRPPTPRRGSRAHRSGTSCVHTRRRHARQRTTRISTHWSGADSTRLDRGKKPKHATFYVKTWRQERVCLYLPNKIPEVELRNVIIKTVILTWLTGLWE